MGLWWKSPRLSVTGAEWITVRTKWQSGIGLGNDSAWALMGNHLIGNERQPLEKVNPT